VDPPVIKPADTSETGNGTLSHAAREAIIHGPLPASQATLAAKAAANRARDEAMRSGAARKDRPYARPPASDPTGGR
ncbi:MAG: hypothetical protein L0Y50_10180, partial [Beijerinckiaceae bacterium]|nr:hypothetical protein [Beijerinckiaceae bacterium]